MFNFEIYREHWMFLAVGTGLVLMLVIVLTYVAVWRTRRAEKEVQVPITNARNFLIWFQRAFPWALILTLAGTWALALIYPFLKAVNPPNW